MNRILALVTGMAMLWSIVTVHAADGERLACAGTIELGVGYSNVDGENNDDDLTDDSYPLIAGEGKGSIPLSDCVSLQLDIGGLGTMLDRADGEADDQLQTIFQGGAHLAYRNPDSFAAGVFGMLASANGGEDESANIELAGIEGQVYVGPLTVYGQAGFFTADDEAEDDVMTDAWFGRGVVRYFPQENTMIEGEVTYAAGEECEANDPDDITAWSWALRVEHALGEKPAALFVEYRGCQVGIDLDADDEEVKEHTVMVGVKMFFGASSLLDNDRRGATFDLPDVGRWVGWTLETVDD